MKNFWLCLILLLILVGSVGGYIGIKTIKENKRLAEIKKGWYVEITHEEPINVRSKPNSKGEKIGEVKKGEIYKALEVDTENSIYYWYKIEYKDTVGWIASGKKVHWLIDHNNTIDIAVPYVKFKENVYKVVSIDDINYKHLEVVEDTDDYEITHVVYHEVKPSEFIDQYWILYTITDGAGKSSSKMQKIEFEERPDESRVKDFLDYKK